MSSQPHHFRATVALRSPYDGDRLFGFLASRAIPGVEVTQQDDAGWRYARTLRLAGGPASMLLHLDDHAVRVSGLLSDVRDRGSAIAAAERILDLDPAPDEVDSALAVHPATAALVAQRPGIRVPGAADGYELVVRAIVGQQISVARASAACGVITREHGTVLPAALAVDDRLTHVFPAAESLAAVDPASLHMPRARGGAITAAAAALAGGEIDLAGDPAVVREQLVALRGIGPWTAGYVSMRACGDPDVLLDGDLIIRRSAEALGMPSSPRALAAYAERFAPYRSYVNMHVWAAYSPV